MIKHRPVIQKATAADAPAIAALVGDLLAEIMLATGTQAFSFDREDSTHRLHHFLESGKYHVFMACTDPQDPLGFITLYESYALYAEGTFGTIAELYVRPADRDHTLGRQLVEQAIAFGKQQGWRRLEVTTPPLPAFQKTLAFYERAGFAITGGRKLKVLL